MKITFQIVFLVNMNEQKERDDILETKRIRKFIDEKCIIKKGKGCRTSLVELYDMYAKTHLYVGIGTKDTFSRLMLNICNDINTEKGIPNLITYVRTTKCMVYDGIKLYSYREEESEAYDASLQKPNKKNIKKNIINIITNNTKIIYEKDSNIIII